MNEPPKSETPLGSGVTLNRELTASKNSIARSLPQWFARANVYELELINAAVKAIDDPKADAETVRAAHTLLHEFERKGQFKMQPSESDLFVLLMSAGLPDRLVVAAMKRFPRDRKLCFIWAMSWQALKWAEQQRAGDLSANAVLRVRASHADKDGRGFVGIPEIADELETAKTTVRRADKRLVKKGLMQFTGDRSSETVKIYQLPLPQKSSAGSSATLPPGSSVEVATKKRGSSVEVATKERGSSATLPLHDTRASARASRNPEPGTTDNRVSSPKNSHLLSSNKETTTTRAPFKAPRDVEEVFEYIFDHKNDDNRDLADLREQIEDGDVEWWFHANRAKSWKGVDDWHALLEATFSGGYFPSQKRKRKGHQ